MAKVSVIMGIYNCGDTLQDAIKCLFDQTYDDWELIMCDDGSTDNTYTVAERIVHDHPEKITLVKNSQNMGLNYTLNKCLSITKGEYIARMDGDDLCSPDRFENEVEVLDNEADISIVSTDIEHFDITGKWGYVSHPVYPTTKDFLHGTPFCHAPCMVRREAYEAVNGYTEDKRLLRVEDYHLWIKMYSLGFKGKNINLPLYQMRDDRNATSRRRFKYRLNEAYVKILAVSKLKLPIYGYIYALRPILVGLLPTGIYERLHKERIKRETDD